MKDALKELKNTLESHILMYVDKEVFIDTDMLGPGCYFDEALSRAICQSICMIVVYTPTYKDRNHLYCQREYVAMENVEKERIEMLGDRINDNGMIIPVLVRGGKEELPPNISNRQYCDFINVKGINKNPNYLAEIDRIAQTVYAYYTAFKERNIDPCCECGSFSLPPEEDIEPWEKESNKPITPFFGRRV